VLQEVEEVLYVYTHQKYTLPTGGDKRKDTRLVSGEWNNLREDHAKTHSLSFFVCYPTNLIVLLTQ